MNADNYSHLTNEQLNQLIHDLSIKSRHEYDNWAGLSENQKSTLRELGASIDAAWAGVKSTEMCKRWIERTENAQEGV